MCDVQQKLAHLHIVGKYCIYCHILMGTNKTYLLIQRSEENNHLANLHVRLKIVFASTAEGTQRALVTF